MLTIIMTSEHICRWLRMLRFLARFSGPGLLNHTRSLADFITTTSVSRFSVHTTLQNVAVIFLDAENAGRWGLGRCGLDALTAQLLLAQRRSDLRCGRRRR